MVTLTIYPLKNEPWWIGCSRCMTRLMTDTSEMSHQERPWASIKINEVITPQSMLDFYSLLQADPSMDHAAPVPDLADVSDRTFISDEDAEWIGSLLAD